MEENTNIVTKPNLSSSNERNTFQKQAYISRKLELGQEPDPSHLDFFDTVKQDNFNKTKDPNWQKDNMEYDLRTTDWILDKVRHSDTYAQNLYASMCNNDFIKNEVWPILTEKTWGCSWRYSGGIIADMLQKGDYIDWYCSGIRDEKLENNDEDGSKSYVPEGYITDEIKQDLLKLGWTIAPGGDNERF